MMAALRAFAKSKMAAVLMGLLIVSFGMWGVKDVIQNHVSDSVVTAGSRKVSTVEFKRIFDGQLKDLQQRTGQAVTAQEAVDHQVDKQVLQQLTDREAILEVIHRSGIQPSPALIAGQLHKFTAFFNPVTGTFDKRAYADALAKNDLTPTTFEASLRDEIAEQQFSVGMVAGLTAPRTYSALAALLQQQNRAVDYFNLDPKSVPTPANPTDAQLVKFMKDNEAQLRRPELRMLSLVRISALALAQTQTVTEASVQQAFDNEKDRVSTPEKRTFVEVPAKDAAQAALIVARLNQGEDATKIAHAISQKPINYVEATKSTVADPAVATAVFSLQTGQVSGPIKGAFGYAVVKLVNITPGKAATLNDARPQIEADLKKKAALDKADALAHAYDDAHSGGAALADAAKKAGVTIYQIGPITQDGRIFPSGQPATGLNAKMLSDAFSLTQGGETDISGLGAGEYYALRVEKIVPSAVPTLNEVRPQVTQVFVRQELIKALQAKADGLAARVTKGEGIDAVAKAGGTSVKHAQGLNQANAAQQAQTLGQEFLQRLFQAKVGETFVAPGPGGLLVGKLTSIQAGAPADVARGALVFRQQLTRAMVQNDLGQMLSQAARSEVKPKVDEKLARSELGVTDTAPASSGAPAPSNKAQ